jgi:hypothetical protein
MKCRMFTSKGLHQWQKTRFQQLIVEVLPLHYRTIPHIKAHKGREPNPFQDLHPLWEKQGSSLRSKFSAVSENYFYAPKIHKGESSHIVNNVMKQACKHEREPMCMNLWVGMDIFGIFWWSKQNITKISLCHVGMMWKIFFHMYMDESHKMDEKFGWKFYINELFGW